MLTNDIARARVYIERINQRLKIFKIFYNKYLWSHAHLAFDIMNIIYRICNLCVPIFGEDRYI